MIGTFIDIGFVVIILIAFFVGVGEGFSKQFSRPLCGLIAIFGAIAVTAILYTFVAPLNFYIGLEEKAIGWFTAPFYTETAKDAQGLATVLSSGYLRLLAGQSELIWNGMANMGVYTLGEYFGKLIIKIAAQFIIWLVLYLAIKYLLYGIKYLMSKIARVVVFKSIDRIFGIIWSLTVTYIIVVGIILTAGELITSQFLPNIADIAANYLSQTTVVKFIHDTNIIGSFLSTFLGWPLFQI